MVHLYRKVLVLSKMDNDKQDGLWYLYDASSILGRNYIYNKMYFPFKCIISSSNHKRYTHYTLEFKCILSMWYVTVGLVDDLWYFGC